MLRRYSFATGTSNRADHRLSSPKPKRRQIIGLFICRHTGCVSDSTVPKSVAEPVAESDPDHSSGRSPVAPFPPHRDLNDRLVLDLIDAVKGILRKE